MHAHPNIRYPELDLLRTVAICGMVFYHGAYDLVEVYGYDIPIFEGPWHLLARATAILFLLLVGVSFVVARTRTAGAFPWKRHLRRVGMVLAGALAVTIVTYLADPLTYVRFGILHCVGVSLLLLPLFRKLKHYNLALGIALIAIGWWINGILIPTTLLLPLGFMHPGFITVDYFPLLPWFGVTLLGMGIGHVVYVQNKRKPMKTHVPAWLTWPGRHSLLIYLVHQPIVLITLLIVLGKPTS